MPQAVKLPDALIDEARRTAARDSRSIAGQIEYWARLGQAVERDLRPQGLEDLTRHGEPTAGAALADALAAALSDDAREAFSQELKARVTYGTHPAFPGYVVRRDPDGRLTPGRVDGGTFVPLPTTVDPPAAVDA